MSRALLTGDDHVRLQDHALEVDARVVQLAEHRTQRPFGDAGALVDIVRRMLAIHQHLGLDDGNDMRFLAQRRVTGERVRVGLDAIPRRQSIGNRDNAAPLGKARAELVVLGEPLAQPVEALGDRFDFCGGPGERLGARIDLDAGNGAGGPHDVDERRAVFGFLANGLVVQDHAGDVGLHRVVRAEQHLAIIAPAVGGGFGGDLVEALLDRGRAFIGCEDALPRRHKRAGDVFEAFGHVGLRWGRFITWFGA